MKHTTRTNRTGNHTTSRRAQAVTRRQYVVAGAMSDLWAFAMLVLSLLGLLALSLYGMGGTP